MAEVVGLPGYFVTHEGLVYSRKHERCYQLLKGGVGKDGYWRHKLSGKYHWTHRIVALTFLERPDTCNTVDHIDGVRDNNNVTNLRWVTSQV